MDVLSSRILLRPGDLDRSRRFYRDVLGLAVYREFGPPDDPGLVFFLGQGLLEVSGHAAGPPGRSVMIWIQVRDVHAEHARLAAAGVRIVREPAAEPWGLTEMQIEDPDGIRIILVEVPADHPLRRDPRPALVPRRRAAYRMTTRSTETRRSSTRSLRGRSGYTRHQVFCSGCQLVRLLWGSHMGLDEVIQVLYFVRVPGRSDPEVLAYGKAGILWWYAGCGGR